LRSILGIKCKATLELNDDAFDHVDEAVAAAVEQRFSAVEGTEWRRLERRDLLRYEGRKFEGGWRLSLQFSDGIKHLDVLITRWFPSISARIALVEHPPRLTWPHVEDDGVLCLLGNGFELDQDDPPAVVENLLSRSCRLIEELLSGEIIERDFQEEFLTYWAYDLCRPRRHYSLLRAAGPSREIWSWNGPAFTLLAETEEDVRDWVRKYTGLTKVHATLPAALLWFEAPPLPTEYPQRARHIVDLARRAQGDGLGAVRSTLSDLNRAKTIVIGAPGRGGPGLVAATVDMPVAETSRGRGRLPSDGFRSGAVPTDILMDRVFGSQTISRSRVIRAEAEWIHGRGRDPRASRLLNSTVVLFGCGSVGSFVAASLLRAGVGKLHVVDCDTLEWSNVGRHHLGGQSVGLNKASEFAARSSAEYPHLDIVGHERTAESVVAEAPDWFSGADLIISTTGSGHADKLLNEWQNTNDRRIPVVYGWTEPFAGAGHALAVLENGPCLSSTVDNLGRSNFNMVTWTEGGVLEEPACGVHFAPYGPIELNHVTSLVCELALDCLLGREKESSHRIWAARKRHLQEFGGVWTEQALALMKGDPRGETVLDRRLPSCSCCSGGGL